MFLATANQIFGLFLLGCVFILSGKSPLYCPYVSFLSDIRRINSLFPSVNSMDYLFLWFLLMFLILMKSSMMVIVCVDVCMHVCVCFETKTQYVV